MFHKEFFPTPIHVLDQMGIDCINKVVLEPSAGKGDIVDYLKNNGATQVLASEINEDLQKILSPKCRIIGTDFLKVRAEQVSHINQIVMNPPFSNADTHILHAWEIAPEGCEIISLCNSNTLDNDYSSKRKELISIIRDYGDSSINLGDCFGNAERKTDVSVSVVRLFKPVTSSSFDYDGFFLEMDDEAQGNGIMEYNEVRSIVNSYVAAVNCFDKFAEISAEMNRYTDVVKFGGGFTFYVEYNKSVSSKDEFAKEMQKKCWSFIFNKMNLDRYVTTGVMKDINKFVEQRKNYPFTMRNVYRMFEVIVGTREQTMNRAIVEAVDNFTKHTDENRFSVEGWKTNSGYMLNRKFITGWISEMSYGGKGLKIKDYNGNFERIKDLTKALCFLTGTSFDAIGSIKSASADKAPDGSLIVKDEHYGGYKSYLNENSFTANKWYEWGFFEFKVFKKGSGHFKFKDEKVWELLNRTYAKIKGQVLPEKL